MPLKKYIEKIRDIINPEFEIGFGKRAYNQDQVMYLHANIENLSNDTGFEPKTTFEEGIEKIISHLANN